MGLLEQYKIGGPSLFNSVDTPYGGEPQPQSKGGVFGTGYSREDIMNALLRAAALAQGNLEAGAQFGQNIGARARAEAEAAAKRQNEWADWKQRQDYTQSNKPDDEFTRNMRAAGIDPESPQGKSIYSQWVQSHTNPPQMVPDGMGGMRAVYPNQAAPTAPVGKITLIPDPVAGGGASNGTGGFR